MYGEAKYIIWFFKYLTNILRGLKLLGYYVIILLGYYIILLLLKIFVNMKLRLLEFLPESNRVY